MCLFLLSLEVEFEIKSLSVCLYSAADYAIGYLAMSQVDRLTELLRTMMDALYTSQLHPNISYQLLSNLLFFTNASLFNTLMEDVEFYW